MLGTRLVSGDDEDAHIDDAVAVVSLAVSQLHQQHINLTSPPATCDEVTRWDSGVKILRYTYIHIHTNLYSAKNRENESEALAQDD